MTDQELDEIAKRAEAATEGPWVTEEMKAEVFMVDQDRCFTYIRPKDIVFMAHARTDVPALVEEVRRLRGGLRRALSACGAAADGDSYMRMTDDLELLLAGAIFHLPPPEPAATVTPRGLYDALALQQSLDDIFARRDLSGVRRYTVTLRATSGDLNITVDAYSAQDAVTQALVGWEHMRVVSVVPEMEREPGVVWPESDPSD